MDIQTTMYASMREVCDCKLSILCGTTKELTMFQRLAGPDKLRGYLEECEENCTKWKDLVNHFRRIVDG